MEPCDRYPQAISAGIVAKLPAHAGAQPEGPVIKGVKTTDVVPRHQRLMRRARSAWHSALPTLGRRRSGAVGVIKCEPTFVGATGLLAGIQAAALDAQVAILIRVVADPSEDAMSAAGNALFEEGAGVVVTVTSSRATLALKGRQTQSAVEADPAAAARVAVEHLIALGHRDVAHIAGPLGSSDTKATIVGWREASARAALALGPLLIGDGSREAGHRLGLELIRAEKVSAVLVGSEEMAAGVVHAARRSGLQLPQDLSVICVVVDRVEECRNLSLTAVHPDFPALGRYAFTLATRTGQEPEPPRPDPMLLDCGSTSSPALTGSRASVRSVPGESSVDELARARVRRMRGS